MQMLFVYFVIPSWAREFVSVHMRAAVQLVEAPPPHTFRGSGSLPFR